MKKAPPFSITEGLFRIFRLSERGPLPDGLRHCLHAIPPIGRQGFHQSEIMQEHGVRRHDLIPCPAGIDPQQERNQPLNDGGIRRPYEEQPPVPLLGLKPDLALAAGNPVAIVLPVLRKGWKFTPQLDDVLVPFHPVVKERQLVTDGLNGLRCLTFLWLNKTGCRLGHALTFSSVVYQGIPIIPGPHEMGTVPLQNVPASAFQQG